MTSNRTTSHVALITGASRGLGAALAQFLATDGYDLILTARGPNDLNTTTEPLRQYGGQIITLPGDMADPAHRAALINAAQQLGRLDVLFNNASTLGPTPLLNLADYPLDAFADVLNINVIAPLGLIQLALPLLKASSGLVVNLSSDAAIGAYPTWGGYGASKAALDLVSRTLAAELEGTRIAVVAVDPGDLNTQMHQDAYPGEDISNLPTPDATLPFWAWLLNQDRQAVNGQRYQAQADVWAIKDEIRDEAR